MKSQTRFILGIALAMLSSISFAATVEVRPGGNLQAAINSAGEGGIVKLMAPGDYVSASRLITKPNQQIIGTTAIRVQTNPDGTRKWWSETDSRIIVLGNHAIQASNGLSLSNLTFPGSAIWGDGTVSDVKLANIALLNTSHTPGHSTAIEVGGMVRWTITDSLMRNDDHALEAFVYTYAFVNCRVAYCAVLGAQDGLHLVDNGDTSTVEQVYFSNQSRNGVEYHAGTRNMLVQDNWLEKPYLQATAIPIGDKKNPNDASMGFSLPSDRSTGTKALRNVIISLERPNEIRNGKPVNIGMRNGFEFAGAAFVCEYNAVIGTNHVVAVTNAAASGSIQHNHFEQFLEPPDTNGGKVTVGDNVNTSLRDRLIGRGRPGPLIRLAALDHDVQPQSLPWQITYSIVDDRTLRFMAANTPQAAASITIECRSTTIGETGPQVAPVPTLAPVAFPATVSGYHPGWSLQIRGIAKDAAGSLLATTQWATLQMPGDPTVTWPPSPATAPSAPTTNLSDYIAVKQQLDSASAERDSLRAILRAVGVEADKIKGLIPQ
jgi:hypothetical protein